MAAALAAVPIAVQLLGPNSLHGLLRPSDVYVIDLANFVVPVSLFTQWVPTFLSAKPYVWGWDVVEATSYVGVLFLLVLIATSIAGWRRPLVRVTVATTLVMAVLSLGPTLHVMGRDTGVILPAAVFTRLPFLMNLLPARLSLFTDFGIAVLSAQAISLARSLKRPVLRGAAVGAVALAAATWMPTIQYQVWSPPVPAFFLNRADTSMLPRGGIVLVVPFPRDHVGNAYPMVWQADAGMRFRMPGGYMFLPAPGGGLATTGGVENPLSAILDDIDYGTATPPLTPALGNLLRTWLAAYQAQAVLVGPMPHRGKAVKLIEDVLGRPPIRVGGVELWLHVWRRPMGIR